MSKRIFNIPACCGHEYQIAIATRKLQGYALAFYRPTRKNNHILLV
jgi:hypothetical protein